MVSKIEAKCNGLNALCPEAERKADGTVCNDNDGKPSTCLNGQCLDVCGNMGMHKCYCDEKYSVEEMCTRCCIDSSDESSE